MDRAAVNPPSWLDRLSMRAPSHRESRRDRGLILSLSKEEGRPGLCPIEASPCQIPSVIPAQAGIHLFSYGEPAARRWIPACAGMTLGILEEMVTNCSPS